MAMNALRFHEYGEPADVLRLDQADVQDPAPDRIRVKVHACGLNPADWALCRGLFPGTLPRGVGLEVSGTVDAIGTDVTDVAMGDLVLGAADYAAGQGAGAADYTIMNHWARIPAGLDPIQAAALPMAIETASRSIDGLGVAAGESLLVSGAGTVIGFAAVQIALIRGARVFATAGPTHADRLRKLGATVTSYADGMPDRVLDLAAGPVDRILDTAPATGILPDLIRIAGGDPRRILTISNREAATELGVRTSFDQDQPRKLYYDKLPEFAHRAANGTFTIPIARTFPLANWREALEISLSGHARGKLILVP
jgi:NADPH:quinone reductase-like Zn-dependent oxidoreductase